jgi:hypothetical protein
VRTGGLLGLVLLCALAGCGAAEHAEEAKPAPVPVRVVTARLGSIAQQLEVTGETAALDVVRLSSPIAGRITSLSALPGDELARDSVAARVLPLEAEAAQRGFELLASGNALAPGEAAAVNRLRREVGSREALLRVPFAAIVSNRLHNPGEQVASGDVLLELFARRSLYVLAQVPLEAIGRIHPGMTVELSGDTASGAGRVAAVLPALTATAVSVPVRVLLATIPERAVLGAPVRCRFVVRRHRRAVLVPRSALVSALERGNRGEIMLDAGGIARRREVRLGIRDQSQVEVRRGLAPGERVLAEGQYALADGAEIEPIDESAGGEK